MNLDELKNIGTHWVCCMPANKTTLWYFNSFGMHYPKEFEIRAKKDKMQVIYNTTKYQDIKSVLCGYFCIYVLHQWKLGNDFYDILKPLSMTDMIANENFVIDYFKNI